MIIVYNMCRSALYVIHVVQLLKMLNPDEPGWVFIIGSRPQRYWQMKLDLDPAISKALRTRRIGFGLQLMMEIVFLLLMVAAIGRKSFITNFMSAQRCLSNHW